jgi:acyl carrier protein
MKDFLENLCNEVLDEIPVNEITAETPINEIEGWDSMCVMLFIGLADSVYDKSVTGEDIGKCVTVKDLHNLIS